MTTDRLTAGGRGSWQKATLCGEIVVNLQELALQMPPGPPVHAWRSPFLGIHLDQFEVLAKLGFRYDSSFAVGDLRSNFPASLQRYANKQKMFRKQPMFTFPITIEDGLGTKVDGVEGRTELEAVNQPIFLAKWTYTLLRNLANGAWTTLLIHPSYGQGVGPENLAVKIDTADKIIRIAKPLGAHVDGIEALGDFWRGRDDTNLVVRWPPGVGYVGTLTTGTLPAPQLSLGFGDRLSGFECTLALIQGDVKPAPCLVKRVNGRVVFAQTLPPKTTVGFIGRVAP